METNEIKINDIFLKQIDGIQVFNLYKVSGLNDGPSGNKGYHIRGVYCNVIKYNNRDVEIEYHSEFLFPNDIFNPENVIINGEKIFNKIWHLSSDYIKETQKLKEDTSCEILNIMRHNLETTADTSIVIPRKWEKRQIENIKIGSIFTPQQLKEFKAYIRNSSF